MTGLLFFALFAYVPASNASNSSSALKFVMQKVYSSTSCSGNVTSTKIYVEGCRMDSSGLSWLPSEKIIDACGDASSGETYGTGEGSPKIQKYSDKKCESKSTMPSAMVGDGTSAIKMDGTCVQDNDGVNDHGEKWTCGNTIDKFIKFSTFSKAGCNESDKHVEQYFLWDICETVVGEKWPSEWVQVRTAGGMKRAGYKGYKWFVVKGGNATVTYYQKEGCPAPEKNEEVKMCPSTSGAAGFSSGKYEDCHAFTLPADGTCTLGKARNPDDGRSMDQWYKVEIATGAKFPPKSASGIEAEASCTTPLTRAIHLTSTAVVASAMIFAA